MKSLMCLLTLGAVGCLAPSDKVGELQMAPSALETLELVAPAGTCVTSDGAVDLRRVLFLENRSIDISDHGTPRRVTLVRESVTVQNLVDQTTLVHDLGSDISATSDIDIQLRLILLDGNLGVYWRETYQHRRYRQGIFRIHGERLTSLCEGLGGANSSH